MPKYNNNSLIASFLSGDRDGTTPNGALHHSKGILYSYSQPIACRDFNGDVVVADYTASGTYISQTTSKHVGMILRSASNATLLDPDAIGIIAQNEINELMSDNSDSPWVQFKLMLFKGW
jgi:hypothetical protein